METNQHKCIKCGRLFLPTQGENIAQCKKCAVKDCKRFIDRYIERDVDDRKDKRKNFFREDR